MAISLREYATKVGFNPPSLSARALAEHCNVLPTVSMLQLIAGGCEQVVFFNLSQQPVFEGCLPLSAL